MEVIVLLAVAIPGWFVFKSAKVDQIKREQDPIRHAR